LVVVNNLYRQETAQIISFPMIFLATGISCYAIYQFFTHSNRVWGYVSPYVGRASGTYISPNNLAGFLEMLLPLDERLIVSALNLFAASSKEARVLVLGS